MTSLAGVLLVLSFASILHPWVGFGWLGAVTLGGALVFRLSRQRGAAAYFSALDDLIYRGERTIVMGALIVMAFAVFLDVVWRTSHSVEGTSAVGFGVGVGALCLVGGLTARWEGATTVKRLAAGVAAFGILSLLCFGIHQAPNGFGWSQKLALVLILWVGMLGASMATKEGRHIAIDAVKKVLPERYERGFEVASGLLTVTLCVVLAVLAMQYARGNWTDWMESERRAFVFESLEWPYWVATIPIPIGFGLMACRFFGVVLHGAKEVDLLTSVGAGGDAEASDSMEASS